MQRDQPPPEKRAAAEIDTTVDLLTRVKAGDADAANQLFSRYLPVLRRWARGRLPSYARDVDDTEDLVQDTLSRALQRLERFEPQHPGALQAYLRQAILNRIRDIVRRAHRHPAASSCEDEVLVDGAASPLEQAIGRQALDRYERGLARLKDEERALVIARVELGLPFADVAALTNRSSADAARMATARALVHLAAEMGRVAR